MSLGIISIALKLLLTISSAFKLKLISSSVVSKNLLSELKRIKSLNSSAVLLEIKFFTFSYS